MQIEKTKISSKVFAQFESVVGIRRSERNLFAIGQLKQDKKDYLIHYFRVKPELFKLTNNHLCKSIQISHPNVQPIKGVIADLVSSEICVLYEATSTLVEQLDSKKHFAGCKLAVFLSQIQAGLQAQKEFHGSENNFVCEWNIFQRGSEFTVGAPLPIPSMKLLISLGGILSDLACREYNSISIVPPEMNSEMAIEVHACDAFFLGILGLRLIGMEQFLRETFSQFDGAKTELFQKAITIVLNAKELLECETLLSFFRQVLEENRATPIEQVTIPGRKNKHIVRPQIGLDEIYSFKNGPIQEPGPHTCGHHGNK